jgi:hypothetical protein
VKRERGGFFRARPSSSVALRCRCASSAAR